ncbi:MAG: UDP-N-acetylglucosamine 2-epimerase (hydrolyzing) [Candidatus Lokiarchaeota archaeon]|nr:UDP-N-acetylglucosamine 2-epimerase (hydrolyzing) [Candidatus Lokiarchaeota archaeon]
MRKICIISGSRAEYGLLRPLMKAIKNDNKLELSLIVTGMHLSKEFGYSKSQIVRDGFEIDEEIKMCPTYDSGYGMARSVGEGIKRISNGLKKLNPDIVLVLGDRIEAFAGGVSAALMNLVLGHIHGGDSARAGLDESMRHSLTKFAHIHFPATGKSAERIVNLGEDKWRIYIVGAPGLEAILNTALFPKKKIFAEFKLDLSKPYILLVQHSVSTEPEKAKNQIQETIFAITKLALPTIIIFPNSDAGGREIIKEIKKIESLKFIRVYKNLTRKKFLSLMKYCSVMIGNSSSGIIESPSFKIPVINIGNRQEGRERSNNVIDVDYNRYEILKSIEKALHDEDFKKIIENCTNPYGDGKASKLIVKVLKKIEINKKLIQKKITY